MTIKQIAVAMSGEMEKIVAVDERGRAWEYLPHLRKWRLLPPLPEQE